MGKDFLVIGNWANVAAVEEGILVWNANFDGTTKQFASHGLDAARENAGTSQMECDVNLNSQGIPSAMDMENPRTIDKMECESNEDPIRVARTAQQIVKVVFSYAFANPNEIIAKIKSIIFKEIKGNCIHVFIDSQARAISFGFETEEEAINFCALKLQEHGIDAVTKLITNNPELDSRKIKLSRPSTGHFNANDIHESIGRFGEIEEFYESRTASGRKRTFIVAFRQTESKKQILCHETLFVGKTLMKVADFEPGLTKVEVPVKLPCLRVSNFAGRLNEYVVKDLMKQLGASFWHMPSSKTGFPMKCIIATFASEYHKEQAVIIAKKIIYEGKKLVISEVDTKCCSTCGQKEHSNGSCPLKPQTASLPRPWIPKSNASSWSEFGQNLTSKHPSEYPKNEKDFSMSSDTRRVIELGLERIVGDKMKTHDATLNEILKEQEETRKRIQNMEDDSIQLKESVLNTHDSLDSKIEDLEATMEKRFEHQNEQMQVIRKEVQELNELKDGLRYLVAKARESEANDEPNIKLRRINTRTHNNGPY